MPTTVRRARRVQGARGGGGVGEAGDRSLSVSPDGGVWHPLLSAARLLTARLVTNTAAAVADATAATAAAAVHSAAAAAFVNGRRR